MHPQGPHIEDLLVNYGTTGKWGNLQKRGASEREPGHCEFLFPKPFQRPGT